MIRAFVPWDIPPLIRFLQLFLSFWNILAHNRRITECRIFALFPHLYLYINPITMKDKFDREESGDAQRSLISQPSFLRELKSINPDFLSLSREERKRVFTQFLVKKLCSLVE